MEDYLFGRPAASGGEYGDEGAQHFGGPVVDEEAQQQAVQGRFVGAAALELTPQVGAA